MLVTPASSGNIRENLENLMQFSQFKNFLGRTMKPGQDKSAFIFQRLVAMDKNTDGGAVEIGDFFQIQNEFMEPSFSIRFHEQGNIVEIVNIILDNLF